MSRHETDSSKVLRIFQHCPTKEVFNELEGIVKRIKWERGFSAARKSRVAQKSDGNIAEILNKDHVQRFRTDGVDKTPIKVAPVKGGKPKTSTHDGTDELGMQMQ